MDVLVQVPKEVDGKPRRRLKAALLQTAGQKAVLALELIEGPAQWTAARAAAVVGISRSYLATAKRASPEQRAALAEGTLTLASLHRRPRRPRPLSDEKVAEFIRVAGFDHVWRVMDQLTVAPMMQAAE